jgi:hypothetical protein
MVATLVLSVATGLDSDAVKVCSEKPTNPRLQPAT